MAATLIQIKSRMLIPVDVEEDEEEIEEEDPRLELVEKLLEYRKFRDLTDALGSREDAAASWYPRFVKPKVEVIEDEDEFMDVSLYDLIKAIRAMLRFVFGEAVHEVVGEGSSVDEKIGLIQEMLEEQESVTWQELLAKSRSKVELVCCLLAILELCRMRRIRAHQHSVYGDIRIFARPPEEDEETEEAEPVAAAEEAAG
jgi:segregation and condensation protein A